MRRPSGGGDGRPRRVTVVLDPATAAALAKYRRAFLLPSDAAAVRAIVERVLRAEGLIR